MRRWSRDSDFAAKRMRVMNRCLLALTIQVIIISGCAKPDRVDRVNSPMAGLFITVETPGAPGFQGVSL